MVEKIMVDCNTPPFYLSRREIADVAGPLHDHYRNNDGLAKYLRLFRHGVGICHMNATVIDVRCLKGSSQELENEAVYKLSDGIETYRYDIIPYLYGHPLEVECQVLERYQKLVSQLINSRNASRSRKKVRLFRKRA